MGCPEVGNNPDISRDAKRYPDETDLYPKGGYIGRKDSINHCITGHAGPCGETDDDHFLREVGKS